MKNKLIVSAFIALAFCQTIKSAGEKEVDPSVKWQGKTLIKKSQEREEHLQRSAQKSTELKEHADEQMSAAQAVTERMRQKAASKKWWQVWK